ncbi:NAD(P)/FAD-dependent oxidoreductase [Streptomyces carpinensis]|uniref:FAD-dependent oxidoreductase n=1 Tax=Streptomyces carpinensis TaxID=66369 RepID=A0ABV1W386_9ACTN|nr:FAD-dependent oxidoreductase [Streptomyces carpinensis]
MWCTVVGAGAWGLPAAAELAARGHTVTLVDRYGVGNRLSSSRGPTRLWRLADPDPLRVRLSRRGEAAMRRLERDTGTEVHLRRGLLWRDETSLPRLIATLRNAELPFTEVAAADVGRFFPGLAGDGRDAVFQPDAGVVLAEAALAAQLRRLTAHGGHLRTGAEVVAIDTRARGPVVHLADGTTLDGDVLVLTAGPGTVGLLPHVGLSVPLRPYVEQVVHYSGLADPASTAQLPGLFDGPTADRAGLYGMPTPGVGYKVGLDLPLRRLGPGDHDRTPDSARTAGLSRRMRAMFPDATPTVVDEQVCTWTDSPDGQFVIDGIGDGVVLACGDSGEGFKYSALMGEVLADLAEGRPADEDIASCSLARLRGLADNPDRPPTSLGRPHARSV